MEDGRQAEQEGDWHAQGWVATKHAKEIARRSAGTKTKFAVDVEVQRGRQK